MNHWYNTIMTLKLVYLQSHMYMTHMYQKVIVVVVVVVLIALLNLFIYDKFTTYQQFNNYSLNPNSLHSLFLCPYLLWVQSNYTPED